MTIHPSSIIDSNASIGNNVEIGPFCTVGPGVKLGDGCKLISHVVLEGDTHIGNDNVFYPFSIIGTEPQDLKYHQEKTGLIIGQGNVFRESVSVHRGTVTGLGETRIGDDNLFMGYVHVAHDCVIGNRNTLANYVGLSGHVTIDDFVTLGGQVGVVQFLRIGSYAYIGGASVIDKNIPPYSTGYGNRIEIKGVNIVGLKRSGHSREVISAISDAHRIYFRSELSEVEALRRIEAEMGDIEEIQQFTNFLQAVGGKVH
jgi:UDP-N-acetylglucosamine acyltransferase